MQPFITTLGPHEGVATVITLQYQRTSPISQTPPAAPQQPVPFLDTHPSGQSHPEGNNTLKAGVTTPTQQQETYLELLLLPFVAVVPAAVFAPFVFAQQAFFAIDEKLSNISVFAWANVSTLERIVSNDVRHIFIA